MIIVLTTGLIALGAATVTVLAMTSSGPTPATTHAGAPLPGPTSPTTVSLTSGAVATTAAPSSSASQVASHPTSAAGGHHASTGNLANQPPINPRPAGQQTPPGDIEVPETGSAAPGNGPGLYPIQHPTPMPNPDATAPPYTPSTQPGT